MNNPTRKSAWRTACLSDCCDVVSERIDNPNESGLDRFIGLEHMKTREVVIRDWGSTADVTSSMKLFKSGDVLVARRNVYLERAARVDFDGVCSGDAIVLRPKKFPCLPGLLPFILNTDYFWQYASSQADGSMSKRLSVNRLMDYEFPLPPLDEQHRIADLLRAVNEEKERVKELLEKISIVNSSLKLSIFSDLHNRVQLGRLLDEGRVSYKTGPFGTVLKASSYTTNGVAVVNPVNMVNGKFVIDEGPYISEADARRLQDYEIKENDIIFARKGDIGRSVFAISKDSGCIIGSDCIRVRVLDKGVLPKYLFYFLTSPGLKMMLAAQSHGTTMPGINEKMLSRMEVSIPPVDKQLDIISRFDQIEKNRIETQKRNKQIENLLRMAITNCLEC